MSLNSAASKPVGLWTIQDTIMADTRLAQHVPRLANNARLNVALKSLITDTLQTGWAADLNERTLTLKVHNQSLASKFKQIVPMLVSGLQMIGWAVDNMEVKVSRFNHPVWMSSKKTSNRTFTARVLSPISSTRIQNSIANLPTDSPMRLALEKILSEHRHK